jgi:outer membrane autotransporter protein
MKKITPLQLLKTPLAVLIGSLCLNQAYAAEWVINDGENEERTLDDGSTWTSDVLLKEDTSAGLTLDNNSTWKGDVKGSATSEDMAGYYTIELNNQSTWQGNASGELHLDLVMNDSTFKGDINISGHVDLNLDGSRFDGNINSFGVDDSDPRFHHLGFVNSVWNGDINGSYIYINNTLENTSKWIGNIDGDNLSNDISLVNHSEWLGNIVNRIDDMNACGCNEITLSDNSRWQGDAALYIDGSSGANGYQSVGLEENSHWKGDLTVELTNSTDDWYSNALVDITEGSSWQGNAFITGSVDAHVHVTSGDWKGNLVLQDYDAAVLAGYATSHISLSSATWTGHIESTGAYTNVDMIDGHWTITGDSKIDVLDLVGDNTIEFASVTRASAGYHTLSLNDLAGQSHFIMRAGYYGPGNYGNDRIIINGDKNISGHAATNNTVTVLNNGSDNTHGTDVITIIETVDGLDQFALTNDVELGGYVYTMEQSGTNWILRPGARGGTWQPVITDPANAAANSVNVNYLLSYADTQTLYQRMGDLRQTRGEGDVWVRGYHGSFDKLSSGLMRGFDMDYNGLQVGMDKKLALGEDSLYLGAMFGMTDSSQSYQTGDGSAKSKHVGIYASYLMENGFYVDALAKYNDLKSNFAVADSMGVSVSGKGNSKGVSASIETGMRFHFNETKQGAYLEPQVQLTYTHQQSDTVNVSNGLRVDLDSYTSLLGRAGMLIGYETIGSNTPVNIYFKTGYIREFDGDTNYALNGSKQNHSFKGGWWNNGIGVSAQFYQNHHVYSEIEKSNGDLFNQQQINFGYRYSF